MAVTENTYTGDGSTVLFSFTFPYLETTDIKVSLDGTTTNAYTLANATTIQFNTAPANGVLIRIFRVTPLDNINSTFFSGSAIRSQDLNNNFSQILYVTQESSERILQTDANSSISGSWSFNVPPTAPLPTADAQLASKAYVDSVAVSGVSDGNKGDVTVSGGGTVWTVTTGGSNLTPADIGVTVQGYDADTAKLDVAQTFTAVQTFTSPVLTTPSITDPTITGTILEDVYTITDGAAFEVDPGNGSVQLVTLGANRTPLATNFAAGESVTLMVDDGTAYTITWTDTTWGPSGVIWAGGSAPTLATSGYTVIQLWKVGSQVYGAKVGEVA